ncbi:hypothetical protein [Novosphingobium kaempferiae]|uniref:hypothetical protein n=1 Tax=Novosphingobium kaempferiae TaxID=2896849 RepID=UPI003B84726B
MAFSAAHEVLLQQSWMEARIDGVVAKVLGKSGVDHFVLVDGPPLRSAHAQCLGFCCCCMNLPPVPSSMASYPAEVGWSPCVGVAKTLPTTRVSG